MYGLGGVLKNNSNLLVNEFIWCASYSSYGQFFR